MQFYNTTIVYLINSHAPLCEKEMRLRPNSAWYSDAIRKAKREKRRRERAWRKSKLEVHRQCFREQCKLVNAMLLDAKTNFYPNKIHEIGNDQQKLFAAANTLLHFKNETNLQNGFQPSSKRRSWTFDANYMLLRHRGYRL